jgi:hypothetical protein
MDDWSPPEADALPEELVGFVKPELQPCERLLWAATQQPRPTRDGRPPWTSSYYAAAFIGLSLALFFVIFGPLRQRFLMAEEAIILVGLITAIVGIIAGIIAVGCWVERWVGGWRSYLKMYALTDRRAVIWVPQSDSGAVEVHTMARGTISSVSRLEYPDGSGDVNFLAAASLSPFAKRFEGVPDVRRVEDLVRRTLIDPLVSSSVSNSPNSPIPSTLRGQP